MRLTSADVRHVTFSKPPIGKRGYHEDEVDTFLDVVQAELARLIEGNTELRTRVEQQRDRQWRAASIETAHTRRPVQPPGRVMVTIGQPVGPPTPPEAGHNAHAVKVLGLAQEMADRLTSEAKAKADGILTKARASSQQLLSEATRKAESMVTQARTRADTMIDDARTQAETLDQQSREQAASREHEAARRHTETLRAINQEKTVLENNIHELRTFEREYRTRLNTCLQSHFRASTSAKQPHRQTRCAPNRTW